MDRELLIWISLSALIALVLVRQRGAAAGGSGWLHALFFLSGFPALLYQVAWQRALFEIYGVNVESVTMVVTAFMLGLGLGSLLGGRLSRSPRLPLLLLFGLAELGVAAFGLVSLRLFHRAALVTAGASAAWSGAFSLVLLLFPTLLMGSTLPLLVGYVVRTRGSVGRAVGGLYFVNTLGSAMACFVAAGGLMRLHGLSGAVRFAAAVNVSVGAAVLLVHLRTRRAVEGEQPPAPSAPPAHGEGRALPFPAAILLAAASGFIALGCEILWYRFVSFATGGLARSFALLLGAYLAGIAVGSLLAERLCRPGDTRARNWLRSIGLLVVLANVLGFLVGPVLAATVGALTFAGTLPLVALAAGLLGATFPLVAHASIPADSRAGGSLSYLYLANIAGSASGSAVIGFHLMDRWPARTLAAALAILGLAVGAALLAAAEAGWRRRVMAVGACAAAAVAVWTAGEPLFAGMYERLLFKDAWSGASFREVIENRSGVITVGQDGIVYGGGAYEGRFNVDLDAPNRIARAYAPASFHRAPRDVLMIGLATGSMGQIVVNHPAVERLTIVEINPGYVGLVSRTPLVASLLRNPKVEVVIDDARRWLVAHPDRKFDLVFMNTPFHYRAHVSALLSQEFLRLVQRHLSPGGVHYFNTTESWDAVLTAAAVFPYRLRVMNFLAVSDAPIHVDVDRWRDALLRYRIDGRPILDPTGEEGRRRLEGLLAMAPRPGMRGRDARAHAMEYIEGSPDIADGRLITDDNMGAEWSR